MEPLQGRVTSRRPAVGALKPPRALATHGRAVWDRIIAEFEIESSAAEELLCLACQSLDRAEDCAEQIARDGLMLEGREHPLVKHELAARSFCSKVLQRLELEL